MPEIILSIKTLNESKIGIKSRPMAIKGAELNWNLAGAVFSNSRNWIVKTLIMRPVIIAPASPKNILFFLLNTLNLKNAIIDAASENDNTAKVKLPVKMNHVP